LGIRTAAIAPQAIDEGFDGFVRKFNWQRIPRLGGLLPTGKERNAPEGTKPRISAGADFLPISQADALHTAAYSRVRVIQDSPDFWKAAQQVSSQKSEPQPLSQSE
jgi:hypothetical protein